MQPVRTGAFSKARQMSLVRLTGTSKQDLGSNLIELNGARRHLRSSLALMFRFGGRRHTERALSTGMESTRERWMDSGEDLVSDGVGPSSDFVRGDGGAVLLADEHDLVPF